MISIGVVGGCVLLSISFLAQLCWPRLFKPPVSPKEHFTISSSDVDYSSQPFLEAAEVCPQFNHYLWISYFHFYIASHCRKKGNYRSHVFFQIFFFWRFTISISSEGFYSCHNFSEFCGACDNFLIHMRVLSWRESNARFPMQRPEVLLDPKHLKFGSLYIYALSTSNILLVNLKRIQVLEDANCSTISQQKSAHRLELEKKPCWSKEYVASLPPKWYLLSHSLIFH